jgi:putative ABC transport system substrate-binding protein
MIKFENIMQWHSDNINGINSTGDTMTQSRARVFLSVVAFFLIISLFPSAASAHKKIGVLASSEQTRYREALNGILDQLRKDGFKEPAVTLTIENAKDSKARMAEVVRKFSAAKMDLIITLGTTATVAVSKEVKDVPIVFSMVYDPVEAGIAKDLLSSGNNTTGASTQVSMSRIMSSLQELRPVKRLAVFYTPGEKQSEIQLQEIQKIQSEFQIKVIPIILTQKEDVGQIASEIVRSVEAVYLTGSSVVGTSVPIIVDIANKAKVVTISHLDDLVQKGVLLGICVNSYQVGRLAGIKAVRILKRAKPSSIPIEVGKHLDIILNRKTVKAGQFQIPPAFLKKVTKTIE